MANITFIILTFNEEKHISRCIDSILPISDKIFIIDSFSTDKTVTIARDKGCIVLQNRWVNHANQFTWGLNTCPIDTDWIMRIDADEYLTRELRDELTVKLNSFFEDVTGLMLNYRHYFWGRWIKYGTRYPLPLLRIWRNGKGSIEQKWMDERIILSSGRTEKLDNDFIHDDLNDLTFFINKHNSYATREAIDLLNKKYSLFGVEQSPKTEMHFNLRMKNKVYAKKNIIWIRSFLYFFYRYFIRLGFLDGKEGLAYHILQGFWYRFLVDMKYIEIEKLALQNNISIREAIYRYSGIEV